MASKRLLQAGDWVAVGDKWVQAEAGFTSQLEDDDRVLAVASTGTLKRIPSAVYYLVRDAVDRARSAFVELSGVSEEAVSAFFDQASKFLSDDAIFSRIKEANDSDVTTAVQRGRSTTRLVLSAAMRADMVSAFEMWRDAAGGRDRVLETVSHDGWSVEQVTAPLGVIGFVFEGRPNVFADATGVLKSGNTAVFRIGSDALGTAHALMQLVIQPALQMTGLPVGSVVLLDSVEHAAGWSLFSDTRLSLAVARGSGETVAELGSIAQQSGIPVSLHGTGGAWIIVGSEVDALRLSRSISNSLDRKVCNTLNVVCVLARNASEVVPVIVSSAREAASVRNTTPVIRVVEGAEHLFPAGSVSMVESVEALSIECEWENDPEFHVVMVETLDDAVELFNRFSPQFIVSVLSESNDEQSLVWKTANAPFVGDGFTRWVDGQFALLRPELGLSNWQNGRLFARSAILSGDSAFSVRMRVVQNDDDVHR